MKYKIHFIIPFAMALSVAGAALASPQPGQADKLIDEALRQLAQVSTMCQVRLDFRLDTSMRPSPRQFDHRYDTGEHESSPDFSLGLFQDEPLIIDDPDIFLTEPEDQIDYDGDGDVDTGDLARAAQNPVADMISLPFQNNYNTDVGGLNNNQNVLNIQPVIPFNLNDDWNLITRTIIPVVYQPSLFQGDDHDFGVGDIQFTAFFSPVKPVNGWIVGAGPAIRAPTAMDSRLGARKWSLGPSAVALRMEGPWVFGALIQNVWSVAGSGDNSVNEFLIQPFVNYNMDDGWYLTSSPVITANWQADSSDDRWTVPVGGGVGKIFRLGDQAMNAQIQAFYNVETPGFGPEWTIRFQLQLLFPR